MITTYIDESGNLGRGGEYFILAAAVFNTKKGDARIKRIIRKEQKMLSSEQGQNLIPEIKSNRSKISKQPT